MAKFKGIDFAHVMSRASLAVVAAALIGTLSFAHASAKHLQSTENTKAVFEVASIKPNHSGSSGHHSDFSHGRLVATNITTKTLIRRAYGVSDYQISGEPEWVDSDAYDIEAKMDDAAAEAWQKLPDEDRAEQYKGMFQALLAERFNLKVGHETKQLPVFALVVAKGGIKFSPTKLPPEDPSRANSSQEPNQPRRGTSVSGRGREYTASGTAVKMTAWASALSSLPELEGRIALDETGLPGEYDFSMKWTRERPSDVRDAPAAAAVALDTSGPSLFTALQEQLGLKLEAKKGPVDTIVIVHIERPSEN